MAVTRRRAGALDAMLLWAGGTAAVLLLGTLIAGMTQFLELRNSLSRQAALGREGFAQHDELLQLVNQESGVRGYVAGGNPAYLSIYYSSRVAWSRDRDVASGLQTDMPPVRAELRRSEVLTMNLERYFEDEISLMAAHEAAAAKAALAHGKILFDDLRVLDDTVQNEVDAELIRERNRTGGQVTAALSAAAVLSVVVLVWIGVYLFLLRRSATYHSSSLRDPLTDAQNRRSAILAIEEYIASGKGEFGVIFLDLDGFKKINDTFGHGTGDRILRSVTARLQHEMRPVDCVGRFGGDEFLCVTAPPAPATEVVAVAHRLRNRLAQPYHFFEDAYSLGCSIGVAMYPADGTTAEALVTAADQAMYQAKSAGGGVRAATMTAP